MPTILLVEDEEDIATLSRTYLERDGFDVIWAARGVEGLLALDRNDICLAILDLQLPDADGLDLCRTIRGKSYIAMLMLTARGDPLDRVVGLELGADDYLPKPFEPRELLARLRAILRRRHSAGSADVLRFGRLEIDKGAREVRLDGQRRTMTGHQFALLLALAERAGRVLSRDALMDLTRGESLEDFDRSIDVHISRLRAAIEDDPKRPRRILTLRGAGYVFAREQDR